MTYFLILLILILVLIFIIILIFMIFLIRRVNRILYIMKGFNIFILTIYVKRPDINNYKFKFIRHYNTTNNTTANTTANTTTITANIVLSHKQDFIKNVYLHFICFKLSCYCQFTYNVLLYLSIFIFEEYLQFKGIKIPVNNIKKVYLIKKRDFFYYISYIYNIINFYIKHPHFYLNLKIFINIFHNFLIILNLKLPYDFLLNETFIKYISIGFWSFFATAFAHKQYKRYKQYKINKNNLNKFFYWNNFQNHINWKDWFRYLKYRKFGGYENYLKMKRWIRLNNDLNKKYELVYNSYLKEFIKKLNLYHDHDFNLDDEEDQISYSEITKNKFFNDLDFNYNTGEYYLYKMFLKNKLKGYSPFFDNIPVPILNTRGETNKKALNDFIYLICYDLIVNKFNWNKKKSSLSNLTEEELFENYKNFYKPFLKNTKSAINLSLNNPLIIPSIPYKDLRKEVKLDAFFEELNKSNDLVSCSLEKLVDLIQNAMRLILESEDILCENADYEEDIKNNKFDKLDLKYYNNDLQLFIWLNNKAKHDKNLLVFLNDFKHYCKGNKNLIDTSIFDINFYDGNEPSFLQSDDLLDLFIHKNFFYLDYFNILVNDNSYSLCYLIFLYKVRKNIIEFERYCETLCKKNFNKYTNTVLNYNFHINKWIKDLKDITKLNLKYRVNSHLLYENNNSSDFLFSLRNKQINFKLLNLKNIKNYKKLSFKKDFNKLTFSINKFNNHFKDYFLNLNYHNITFTEQKSFEEFFYDLNGNSIKELNNEIYDLKSFVIHYLSYYKFDDNQNENSKILINFNDIGVYLYDIPGYEFTREDTELFYLLKEYPLFDFDPNKFPIRDSKKALISASIMFFHYVIKNFKNLKTYIACIPNEHLLFKEFEFYYKNFDTSMHGNRDDFLVFLNNFIPVVKSITLQKDKNILNTLHFFMMHLKTLEDALNKFPLDKIYDNKSLNESEAIELDIQFHDIMDIWRHVLNFIIESRHVFINYINLLRYDKIHEFLDYPMFQKSASFLLLKKNVFYLLKQLIIEERLYDHIHNISMFFYRIYDRPNMHLRQNVLIANAILPTVYYLDCDDLQYIFSLEEADPLIFIKLYNSKQRYLYSAPWSFSVSFETVLRCLINLNERDTLFNDQDLKQFYERYKNRDLIIYDLTSNHFDHLVGLLKSYNEYGFNEIADIKECLIDYLTSNSFEYNSEKNIYKKSLKLETVELKDSIKKKKKEKKSVKEHVTDVINIDLLNIVNMENKNKKLDFFDAKINNTFFDTYKFTIFKNTLDCNLISYSYMSLEMVEAWNEKIIKLFPRSSFKNYLLDSFYLIKGDSFYFNNPEALIHAPIKTGKLVRFVNYINYLINFYDSIILLNELSESQLNDINNIILNDSFDLLKHGNIEVINKKFSLNYLSFFFRSLNKLTIHKSWKYSLDLAFNNKNLFAYFKGFYYLMELKQMFPQENNLPNLTNYIIQCNYNNVNNNKYNLNLTLTCDNTLDTLYSIFQFLNLHILKLNHMLKTLIYFKTLLKNIYLNFCTGNINNVQILNKMKIQLNKEQNNFMYIDLINILIYIKDPIYLYNILSIDVQLYLSALLDIYNIIQEPDKTTKVYDEVIKLSMLKKHTRKNTHFHPFYKGWTFNENFLENKEKDTYLNNKLSDFFSTNKIDALNGLISSLTSYQNNGFFNLLNEVDDGYLLEKLNVKNILNKVVFKDLFTVYNLHDLELFDINKLMHYFELNNNFELDIYHRKDLLNYKDLLIYLFLQKDKYRFLFPDPVLNNNNNKKKNILNKAKEFLGFDTFDTFSYDLNKKKEKRKSCMSSFYIHDKKYKTIIKKKKREWFDEEGTPIDVSELGSIIAHDDVSSYEELNITDEEQQVTNLLEPVDSESEELTELELKHIEEERLEAEKRALHQSNLITILLREYRQWYSDIEFNKAYQICKRDFNIVFYQIKHPIWDDIRHEFVNEKHFYLYVNSLSEKDKNIFFDNYWSYTINSILEQRELKKQGQRELKWFNILNWSITNKRTAPFSVEELCNAFNLEMDYSLNWKRKWNDRNYHLFPKRNKKSNFLTEKQWEEFYGNEDVGQKIEMHPRKLVKKKKKVFKLWDKNNWWKLF